MSISKAGLIVLRWSALDQPQHFTFHPSNIAIAATFIENRLAEQFQAYRREAPNFPPKNREEWLNYKKFCESADQPSYRYMDEDGAPVNRIPYYILDDQPGNNALNTLLAKARQQILLSPHRVFQPNATCQTFLRELLRGRPCDAEIAVDKTDRLYALAHAMPSPFPCRITPDIPSDPRPKTPSQYRPNRRTTLEY